MTKEERDFMLENMGWMWIPPDTREMMMKGGMLEN